MELLNEQPPVEMPEGETPLVRKAMGPLALLLMFAVSGVTTVAYLSGSAQQVGAHTAAAAETLGPDPYESLELQAQSVYVLDLSTNRVLFERNPDTQLPLASLTKVAMALAVSEVLSPDSLITIPEDTSAPGSAERLAKGQTWKVQDVINFTLIASSNGGADILANAADDNIRARYPTAPSGSAVLWRMNDIAHELGLSNTYFLNDNGLDVSTTQAGAYGSARDVAKLFAYAAAHAQTTFAGTTRDGLLLTSLSGGSTSAFNTNQALGSIPGLVMGKTGLTDLAGGNLAVVFNVGPAHPVVAVVLHSSETARFDDMKKLVAATVQAISQGR